MPTTISNFRGGDFAVIHEHGVFEQEVGDTVTGLQATSLNRNLLVATTGAVAGLVFEVMTEQAAKLPLVRALNQREVIFPDIEVFTIGPRRLVPDVGVSALTPEKRRNSTANRAVAVVREDGRNLGSDLILQRLRLRRSSDDDVVAGD